MEENAADTEKEVEHVVHELKVSQNDVQRLGERASVPHKTHQKHTFVDHLKTQVRQQETVKSNNTRIFRVVVYSYEQHTNL